MLTRKERLFLASASIGAGIFFSLNSNFLPLLLNLHTSSPFLIGLVIGIDMFLGVIVPPIIGTISDGTWTRMGRRRPYMITFAPLSVITLIAVFLIGRYTHFDFSFILLAILIWISFFFFNIWNTTYTALLPDLTESAERGETSGYMQAFSVIGTIIAFAIGAILWESYSFLIPFILAGLILLSVGITILKVKEKKPRRKPKREPLSSIARDFINQKEFAKFMFASIFWWLALGSLTAFFVLFAKYSLGLSESAALTFMGVFTVVLIMFAVPAGIFADRFGKKKILVLGLLLAASGFLLAPHCSYIHLLYLSMGLIALGFGTIIVLNFALTADLLPKGKEGKFMGIGNIFSALPQSIAPPLTGFIIALFNNNYTMMFFVGAVAVALGLISIGFVEIKT